MKKTAPFTAVSLTTVLFLALGSSWADESRKADEARTDDEIARRLAERLEPDQVRGRHLGVQLSRARPWRVSKSPLPMTPCLARSESPDSDPCAVAEALSRLPPCLDLESCQAIGAWRRIYGLEEPRIVPAEPVLPSVPSLASAKEEEE